MDGSLVRRVPGGGDRRPHPTPCSGQATIEWLGTLAVVAALLVVLLSVGLAGSLQTRLERTVGSVLADVTGGHGSTTADPGMLPVPAPGGSLSWSDLPHGPGVAPLTKANEMTPWTRIGMTEAQWDQLQSEILSRVNPHGVWALLFGDRYAMVNLDKDGHLVLVPIDQDGIGEGIGDLLEDLTGAGKALASGAAEALADAVGSLSGPVLAKLAQYGLLDAGEVASKDFATETGQAFFWSGRTDGVSAQQVAEELASGRGGTTLEGLVADRGIQMPPYDPDDAESVTAWEEASQLYAQHASGTVYAVVGDSVREGSVWSEVELPALEDNPAVTRIVRIDPKTRAETVISP